MKPNLDSKPPGRWRLCWLVAYYLLVLLGLLALHSFESFSTPPFIYQGF